MQENPNQNIQLVLLQALCLASCKLVRIKTLKHGYVLVKNLHMFLWRAVVYKFAHTTSCRSNQLLN